MKLQHIIEARYHGQKPYVRWTQEIIQADTHSRREAVKLVPKHDVVKALEELTRFYGKHHKSAPDSDGQYYIMWENEPGNDDEPHWNILLWPTAGHLVVHRWDRSPVKDPADLRMFEARHHRQLHPIVRHIKDIIDANDNLKAGYQAEEFQEIPGGQEKMVVNDLIKAFGQPLSGEVKWDLGPLEDVIPWKTWGVISPNGRIAYSIDIGYDDLPEYAHAPYGVNLTSMVVKKKKKK